MDAEALANRTTDIVLKSRIALIVGAGFSCEAQLPSTEKVSQQFLKSVADGVVPIRVEDEISEHLAQILR
jgi:hypothetical protein